METSDAPAVGLPELVSFLDHYLDIDAVEDYCPNGLQVEGRSPVRRVVTGVSACQELFRIARQRDADAIIVHHGLFWRDTPRTLTGLQYERVAELIRGELSLLAYHLPLDRHPVIGNNATAAARLELVDQVPFGKVDGIGIGVAGRLPSPTSRSRLLEQIGSLYRREPLVFPDGPEHVEHVALVSGAGSGFLEEAAANRIDLFITGEAAEWTMHQAREYRLNVVAAGHHATERLGVEAVAGLLQERFGIVAEFVDIPNPI